MGRHRFGYVAENTQLRISTNPQQPFEAMPPSRLQACMKNNLRALALILHWNYMNRIAFFSIGSGVIPDSAHTLNPLSWPMVYADQLQQLGQWSEKNGIRLTMHARPFVALNSKTPSVIQWAFDELNYLATFLGSLGMDTTCKILLSGGGLFGSKEESLNRLIQGLNQLPCAVKRRVVLENDDQLFTIWDMIQVSKQTDCPVVFNVLNHDANHDGLPADHDLQLILKRCFATWNPERDGIPYVRYGTQDPDGQPGAPARAIDLEAFLQFFHRTKGLDYDVLFQSWDKEQSVLNVLRAIGYEPGQSLADVS